MMYSILVVAATLSFLNNLGFTSYQLNGNYCGISNPQMVTSSPAAALANTCTEVMSMNMSKVTNTTWSTSVSLDRLELYFSIGLSMERGVSEAKSLQAKVEITVFAESSVPAVNSNGTWLTQEENFFLYKTLFLICGSDSCDSTSILDESEYIYNIDHQHTRFNVTIQFFDVDPIAYFNATNTVYSVTYHDANFRIMEMIFHSVFSFFTFVLLIAWLLMLHRANALQWNYITNWQKIFSNAPPLQRFQNSSISETYSFFGSKPPIIAADAEEKEEEEKSRTAISMQKTDEENESTKNTPETTVNVLNSSAVNISANGQKMSEKSDILKEDKDDVTEEVALENGITENADFQSVESRPLPSLLQSEHLIEENIANPPVSSFVVDELVLFEQKWIAVLLFALFLYQNPIYVVLIFYQISLFWLISGISAVFAFGILMLFWLVLIDALGLMSPPASWLAFYGAKYFVFFTFEFFAIYAVILFSTPNLNQQINVSIPQSTSSQTVASYFRYDYASLFTYFSGIIIFYWACHFLYTAYGTNKLLKSQPYLITRHRQLTLRVFLFMSNLVIVYYLVYVLNMVLTRHLYTDVHDQPFPTFLIVSVYVYLTAYIYIPLPPPRLPHGEEDATKFQLSLGPIFEAVRGCGLGDSSSARASDSVLECFSLKTAKFLCEFSWEAYFSPPNVEQFGFQKVRCIVDEAFDTVCFIAVRQNTIVISFRGSVTLKNAIADFQLIRSPLKSDFSITGSPMVHTGFYDSYNSVRSKILATIGALIQKKPAQFRTSGSDIDDHSFSESFLRAPHRSGTLAFSAFESASHTLVSCFPFTDTTNDVNEVFDKQIGDLKDEKLPQNMSFPFQPLIGTDIQVYCTGHSLGGALSTLCSFDLAAQFPNAINIEHYNFGSPRVGDYSFASLYNEAVPKTYRIVHDRDMITSVPKFFILFKHVGYEIVVDKWGNYIENPSFVEKTMRASRNSLADHQLICYREGLHVACKQQKAISKETRQISVAVAKYLQNSSVSKQ